MPAPHARTATGHAFVTASASLVCLLVAESFRLEHANLAVWTTFLVMTQFTFTSFQKGIERILGRALGILAGLVLTTWFNELPLVAICLIFVVLTGFFYLYFSGRLAYTFLQAGLYLVAVFQIGHTNPTGAVHEAKELFAAVVVGVLAADVVTWLAGAEGDFRIRLEGKPLWPLRADWMNQSAMLAITVLLTLVIAHATGLPPEKAAISVLLLTITPHLQALIQKGELRIAGLLLATLWSLLTFVLVGLLPYFPLLAVLVFLGMFISTYVALTAGTYAYVGVQMGLVIPLVVVIPPSEFGSVTPAAERLAGILLGLAASVIVAGLWPRFPVSAQPVPTPAPSPAATPGEMDV